MSPTRWIHAGGNGSRTVSKWARAITARRRGLGMPRLLVLPSWASENIVSISRSNWSAGRTSHTKRAVLFTGVPELVPRAGRDEDAVTGPGR